MDLRTSKFAEEQTAAAPRVAWLLQASHQFSRSRPRIDQRAGVLQKTMRLCYNRFMQPFIIWESQMAALQTEKHRQFSRWSADYLAKYLPATVEGLVHAEIEARSLHGVSRALRHGVRDPASMFAFIRLMFEYGPGFDSYPRFRKVLATAEPGALKIESILSSATQEDWKHVRESGEYQAWSPL